VENEHLENQDREINIKKDNSQKGREG